MKAERMVKRVLEPIASPASRRALIGARNTAVGVAAELASRFNVATTAPAFVIIGAQKGGTTFLFQELLRHPEIHPALTKELHYFDSNYSRGHEWYLGHFVTLGRKGILAEASPSYLFHPHAPIRLANDLPSTKVIAVLRDPVARAFSHWRHERRLGFEPLARFEDAIRAEEERTEAELARIADDPDHTGFAWRHFTYRARGCYVDQLERWVAACGSDRVLVLDSSELYANPVETLDAVHQFLAVDSFRPTDVGRNDMAASDGEKLDPAVEGELRQFFEPWNRRLMEQFGIGGKW